MAFAELPRLTRIRRTIGCACPPSQLGKGERGPSMSSKRPSGSRTSAPRSGAPCPLRASGTLWTGPPDPPGGHALPEPSARGKGRDRPEDDRPCSEDGTGCGHRGGPARIRGGEHEEDDEEQRRREKVQSERQVDPVSRAPLHPRLPGNPRIPWRLRL